MSKIKHLFILFALFALGQTAWAQTPINVGNEQQLRTNLESLSECTINLMADIDLNSGNITVNHFKTLNMNGHTISVNSQVGETTRLFNMQTSAQFTISGQGTLSGHTNTSDGGLIYLNQNATLTLSGATLTLNINGSVTNGGAIYNNGGTVNLLAATLTVSYAYGVDVNNGGIIYNAGTLNMNSGTTILSGGKATNGGAIYLKSGQITAGGETTFSGNHATSGGALYMNGGTALCSADFINNSAVYGGAIYNNEGTLTINGGNIGGIDETDPDNPVSQGNIATTSGGAIYNFAGTLNISGGSISYNSVENINGGGIFNLSGNINISGGSISHNSTSAKDGGGIHSESGTIVMTGGSISNNTAGQNCGGVNLTNVSTMTMSGGSIANNTAGNNDGGVYIGNGSTLTMTGGSITGNTATRADRGGGISVVGTLKMSGSPIVMGNFANGNSKNVYLPSGKKITVIGAFTTGAIVGVTCQNGVNTTFTSGFGTYSSDNLAVFSSDNTSLEVTIENGEAKLIAYDPTAVSGPVSYLDMWEDDRGTKQCSNYTKMSTLTDNSPTLSNGWYVVDKNLTFNSRITISGTVNLILMDNTHLVANKGIFVPLDATLHIWAQSTKTADNDHQGVIRATSNEEYYSGIGGYALSAGYLYFHGGIIGAMGGNKAAGVFGVVVLDDGIDGIGIIDGGIINEGYYGTYIYGGQVVAQGGQYGAGIGGPFEGTCGNILITGGLVFAQAGEKAAGIGSGFRGLMHFRDSGYTGNPEGREITVIRITGGDVTAIAVSGAGIGGGEGHDSQLNETNGYEGDGAEVYIDGGRVEAWAKLTEPAGFDNFGDNLNGNNAIGWGYMGTPTYGANQENSPLQIYASAKISATTNANALPNEIPLLNAGAWENNAWTAFKKIIIEPCDHPEHNNPVSYTNNTEEGNLSVNCPYCYSTEPYTFQITGNWNTAANWLGSIMPGAGKNVAVKAAATIPATCCAHVGNIDMQEGGSLTINDGGQLIHSNAGVVATVEKIITGHEGGLGGGWNFIASPISTPVNPSTISLITDDFGNSIPEGQTTTYDLYYYDEPNVLWKNYRNASFDLNNGQGYLYANNAGTTLSMTGTLQPSNETVTISGLSHSASTLTGWNLVGNPFACNATIDKPCYTLSGAAINTTANTANTYQIAPCEAVMVQADDMNESVTFTRVEPASQASQPNNGNMRIMLSQVPEPVEGPARHQDGVSPLRQAQSSTALLDNAIVSFNEGEQLGKFYFGEQNANIYIPQGDKEYAIAYSDKQGEMPLNFKATEDGQYTITVNPDGVEMTYLHLIDNMTGADVDLLAATSTGSVAEYTFTAKTTDYESRFRLVFSADEAVCEPGEAFAYISDGNIIVNGTGTLQVIDLLGRQLSSQEIHSAFRISYSAFPTGVYVLRLINGNDVKTQKIVVR